MTKKIILMFAAMVCTATLMAKSIVRETTDGSKQELVSTPDDKASVSDAKAAKDTATPGRQLQNNEKKNTTRGIYILGDANKDGEVNVLDVTVVINYILGKDVYLDSFNADVNDDNEINVLDVVEIQNIFLSSTSSNAPKHTPKRVAQ